MTLVMVVIPLRLMQEIRIVYRLLTLATGSARFGAFGAFGGFFRFFIVGFGASFTTN